MGYRARLTAATVTAVLAAAAAVVGVPGLGGDGHSVPGFGQPPAARAAGTVCVGVVVDPAQLGGSTTRSCVTVPAGSTGTDALYARASALGRPAPRFDSNGLLCAIDGAPATGCGDSDGTGGYSYWSYWRQKAGASSWTYSRRGPGFVTVATGDLEGWHWSAGGPAGKSPPPAASYRGVCPPSASPTPARTTAPAPARSAVAPVPPRTRATGPAAAPTTGGSSGRPASTAGAAGTADPATSPTATGPGASVAMPATPTSPAPSTSGPEAGPSTSITATPSTTAPTTTDTPSPASTRLAGPVQSAGHTGGSAALPTLIGLAVVVVITGVGTLLARRRRASR